MARALVVPFLLLVARANLVHRRGEPVSPRLTPESPSKFLGDYTNDKQPTTNKHYNFGHPYPIVQESMHFDDDYVKDDNSDGGKWAAQMHYDVLRSKVRSEEKKLDAAKEKATAEREQLEGAKEKEKKAARKAQEAEKATSEATEKEAKASEDVNKLEGTGGKDNGAVKEATNNVEQEMDDLKGCKKKLAKAEARLRELQRKKEALQNGDEEIEEEVVSKAGMSSEERLVAEKAEHEKAAKAYNEEAADVKRMEAELEAKGEKLRKLRAAEDNGETEDGGVYPVKIEKSSAVSLTMSSPIALLMAALASAAAGMA